ncbi:ribokinase [Algoriphagus sp.]|uniref:ribokinase n=1 Tax=Algoriphagus sp. TaxID=1872435 RepID=UPI0032869B7B
MKKIIVVGSSNTDLVVRSPKLPEPGETLIGSKFFSTQGGKGANQAVAAKRAGGEVIFIAKVGNDGYGKEAVKQYDEDGICTDFIKVSESSPTGIAIITVDDRGENTIVVASGANSELRPIDLQLDEEEIREAEYFLVQLETPLETVNALAYFCRINNKKLVLNPAPATPLSAPILQDLFMITPNETEAELLTGVKIRDLVAAKVAAGKLIEKGVKHVIITLGERGAFYHDGKNSYHVPSPKVNPVDTTAAGDTFNGALIVALSEGKGMEAAIEFANKLAGISTTKEGAQASIPYRKEIVF